MMTHLEIHEALLYATARGALGAGGRDAARAALVEALERCGVAVARPIDGPDLDGAPAIVLVTGATVEDSVHVAVIPEAAVTAEVRAAIDRCDRADINYETLDDDPALAAAYAVVTGETVWPFDVYDREAGALRAGSLCRPLTRIAFVWEWT